MSSKQHFVVIGDTHYPAVDKRVINEVLKYVSDNDVTHIVQIGDLYDLFAFSRFAKTLNWMTPKDELALARTGAELMWKELRKAAPKAKCIQLLGNHDARIQKKILDRIPEFESLFDTQVLFKFKDVYTAPSDKTEIIIGDKLFIHGHSSRLGQHMRRNGKNTICGHSHKGGVIYEKFLGGVLYEANAGYTGDPDQPVFKYGAQDTDNWTRGFLTIDGDGPKFICLENKLYDKK